jgi:hypothetical protein
VKSRMVARRLREFLLRTFRQTLAVVSAVLATTAVANINEEVTATGHPSSLWWTHTSLRAANSENCDIDWIPGLLGALDHAPEGRERGAERPGRATSPPHLRSPWGTSRRPGDQNLALPFEQVHPDDPRSGAQV